MLKPGAVVVNKSTVPVGSTVAVETVLQRDDVFVVSNPEFLREGTAVGDFLLPDRVVIGSADRGAAERVASSTRARHAGDHHRPGVRRDDQVRRERVPRDEDLFVNAVAAMCEAVGADVAAVVEGIGSDSRIGGQFLKPGPGWGGVCFPKDSRALVKIAEEHGYDFSMMRGVIDGQRRAAGSHDRQDRDGGRAHESDLTGVTVGRWADVQGRHRRPARVAGDRDHRGCSPPARRCGRTTRPRSASCRRTRRRARRHRRGRRSARRRRRAPMSSSCSPSGPSSPRSTSTTSSTAPAGHASSSTPATCSTRAGVERRPRLRRRRAQLMRVVVAGGAGFLGSHLCDALLDRGDEVVVRRRTVDRSPSNVAHLADTPRSS